MISLHAFIPALVKSTSNFGRVAENRRVCLKKGKQNYVNTGGWAYVGPAVTILSADSLPYI